MTIMNIITSIIIIVTTSIVSCRRPTCADFLARETLISTIGLVVLFEAQGSCYFFFDCLIAIIVIIKMFFVGFFFYILRICAPSPMFPSHQFLSGANFEGSSN